MYLHMYVYILTHTHTYTYTHIHIYTLSIRRHGEGTCRQEQLHVTIRDILCAHSQEGMRD